MNIPAQQQTQPSAAAVTSLSGFCWNATCWEGREQQHLEPAQSGRRTEKVQTNQETKRVLIIFKVAVIGRDDKNHQLNQLDGSVVVCHFLG